MVQRGAGSGRRARSASRRSRHRRRRCFPSARRLPNTEPLFPYPYESESIAAIQLQTYDHWWAKQIEGTTRNQIRKSQKLGVEVRECAYDDDFVRGMTSVFNETPIRQGRRFWHYGKDFETVKRQFSRNLFREDLIGAYYQGELIGFAMLGRSTQFVDLGQIISKVEHRDKSVTSALIAKAVELCCAKQIPYLVYAFWSEDSLGHFKRRLGFREARLPRYFVPLTAKGKLAMQVRRAPGVESAAAGEGRCVSETREKRLEHAAGTQRNDSGYRSAVRHRCTAHWRQRQTVCPRSRVRARRTRRGYRLHRQ